MSKNGRVKIDGVIFNENIFFLKPKFHYEIEELKKESENSQIVLKVASLSNGGVSVFSSNSIS